MSYRATHDPLVGTSAADTATRLAVLSRFDLGGIQHLHGAHLTAAQKLCGHGSQLGRWETDAQTIQKHYRSIDLANRIRSILLARDPEWTEEGRSDLITEGVLTLTRLGLLGRLAPTAGRRDQKNRRLMPSTISNYMHQAWPRLAALAIHRKARDANLDPGLFCCLSEADLLELSAGPLQVEIERLDTLASAGLWWDLPVKMRLPLVTNPAKQPWARPPQKKPNPYPPLPDDWLAEIGPRVLWIVNELAPNLLRLLERLREILPPVVGSKIHTSPDVSRLIRAELQSEPWRDHSGQELAPPFPLQTASGGRGHVVDKLEWPIRTWEQVCLLSTTVQAAHAFIALLGTAGRLGEGETLERSCVVQHADGEMHVHGRTYKLKRALHGETRGWPAPDILVKALGQQARLAAAWDWLPLNLGIGVLPDSPQFGDQLWVSIGASGNTGPEADFDWQAALMSLARRVGVDPRPGGKNVHPHRFRKTIGRLAGIALWNSPLVLKQLLGHKDIEMTLHYILCDPGIREEAEKVLRELRVMHCAKSLQQVREAVQAGLPNPFGGAGGNRMASAVVDHEKREAHAQRTWHAESAYNLAVEYTMNGLGWRLGIGFVCSKLPHEAGDCRKGASRRGERGEPLITNCKPTCVHRCELPDEIARARQQRDLEDVCQGYLAIATQACDEGQLLVAASCLQQLNETLGCWPELKARYEGRPDVQALVATLEPACEVEAAHG